MGSVSVTTYAPGVSPVKEKEPTTPSMVDVVVVAVERSGFTIVTVTPFTPSSPAETSPVSSVSWRTRPEIVRFDCRRNRCCPVRAVRAPRGVRASGDAMAVQPGNDGTSR